MTLELHSDDPKDEAGISSFGSRILGRRNEGEITKAMETVENVKSLKAEGQFLYSESTDLFAEMKGPEYQAVFDKKTKGKPLLDIAANSDVAPKIDFANRIGASACVVVGAYEGTFINQRHNDDLPVEAHENVDLLRFLITLPDNSCSVSISRFHNYSNLSLQKLCVEIQRVVGQDHVVLGVGSKQLFDELEKRMEQVDIRLKYTESPEKKVSSPFKIYKN